MHIIRNSLCKKKEKSANGFSEISLLQQRGKRAQVPTPNSPSLLLPPALKLFAAASAGTGAPSPLLCSPELLFSDICKMKKIPGWVGCEASSYNSLYFFFFKLLSILSS